MMAGRSNTQSGPEGPVEASKTAESGKAAPNQEQEKAAKKTASKKAEGAPKQDEDADKPEWNVETHGAPPAGHEDEYDIVATKAEKGVVES
jgi:hypothetical protein